MYLRGISAPPPDRAPSTLPGALCPGERYVSGVGQVEPFDEVRREIIHQLSIRPMAHSELVKALPENSDLMLALQGAVLLWAGEPSGGGWTEAMLQRVLHLVGLALLEEQQQLETRGEEDVSFRYSCKITRPGEAPSPSGSVLALLESLQNAPHLEMVANVKTMRERSSCSSTVTVRPGQGLEETLRDRDQLERKRKAEMARLRREKIMAQMSEMQKHFINENKDLFLEASGPLRRAGRTPPVCLKCVCGPRRSGAAQRRQLVTCILCQEEQEVRGQGRAMVLAAFVQRSTVLSKNRRRSLPEPVHYDPLFMHPDLFLGTHTASCGHIMHADCWQRYFEAVQVKEQRRQQRLRGHTSYDVEHGEFLCPLCECLSNTVIPLLPHTHSPDHSVDHPSLETWLKTTNQQIAALCSAHRKQSGVEGAEPEVPEGFRVDLTPQNPFSSSISEMITTFSMSIYKVSLKLNPNEQDPRVPVLSWATCAYTIQSIERLLMDEDKPLFGSLPCRQDDCLSSLTRCTVCVMSYSSIHCLDQSEHRTVDSAHLHLLHLVTVAHLVQILLTSITEEVCMDQDSEGSEEEELTCQLYNTLRKHLGSVLPELSSGCQLSRCGGGGMVRFPRESNQLIELPEDYSTLINQGLQLPVSPVGGDKSRAPTLCLVCGCCCAPRATAARRSGGGRTWGPAPHTPSPAEPGWGCSSGNTPELMLMLTLRLLLRLLLRGQRESGVCLLQIERLWQQHGVAEVIGHAQEANQTLVAIDWQHL
ncbi:hypothetical protein F7725_023560 [Dissostichus mawsoni]|uniref:E3 ubiquitin-protein ligase n=1 Tax=Dissostichus mawsoni TaxID=36200 RepID=A0A7J5XYI0_DISMA|nr:hypothetical protein F7725_023560 [Dissostichus mawsoni]